MKLIRTILMFSLAILIFTACKKETIEGPQGPAGPAGPTTSVNPAIYGSWEVLSGMPGAKYFILKNTNFLYRLDSLDHGFKSLTGDMALLTYTQIYVFRETFNYSINNDTLKLVNLNRNITLKKKVNAPDETDWVIYATVIDSIVSPTHSDGREDIGFDGTNILWTAKSTSDTIFKINPLNHAISYLHLSNGYYYGSTTFATFLWISDNSAIDKVNPTTGAVLGTSPALGTSRITANALVGSDMWYCEGGNIKTWNIVSDVITPQFHLYTDGMEYTGGFLYFFNNNQIYKCQLSPLQAIETYYIDHQNIGNNNGGLTYDGTHFWVVGYDNNTNKYLLYKLSI
ncbi:MAG TPA: hypothetical protein PKL96_00950 [Bacteroidales bacterium]|nr:hypothetical protein [Bacteroidales bacterium]